MSKIIDVFEKSCIENKDKYAFYFEENKRLITKTFDEVYKDTNEMVDYLLENGIKQGDKILAFANSNYKLCVFIIASFKIGATIMYIDIFAKQDKMKNLFEKYKPDYVLVSNKTKYIKVFFKEINKIKTIINIDNIKGNNNENKITDAISDNQAALLTTTTGSTGTPKIVIRTHNDLYEQLNLITNNIEKCRESEIVLTTSYIYVLANLLQGFTTVLPNINLNKNSKILNEKLSLYKDIGINMIITSPDFCLKTNNIYPKLEYLYFGGAILNYTEAVAIQKKFNKSNNIYMYGCTECNIISKNKLNLYISDLKKLNINNLGQVVKGVKVKIGEHNKICVSSNALTNNYIDNSNLSDSHDTGDRGYLNNNELIFLGKENAALNINDDIIYSNQIEQELVLNYKLNKCAILEYNKKFYLFLEERNKALEIKEYLKQRYKINTIIKVIKKIPCDIKHHTKINYKELKELI